MGLLKRYLESVQQAAVTVLPNPPTQGTRKGVRLDRWLRVQWPDKGILFQVEIKNWSAHSLGGKELSLNATTDALSAYRRRQWKIFETKWLPDPRVRKVLVPMKKPEEVDVEPVACFWLAMHPEGDSAPWFSIDLPASEHFRQLWVFSMSNYLRSLTENHIVLEMPQTVQRVLWLNKLFNVGTT